jgi:hypothetical protein
MFAKEIKLAEKLIKKKQPRDGILLLLKTLAKLNNPDTHSKKEYQTAGQLFASLLVVKSHRVIIEEYVAAVSQNGVIFLLNIAVEFGQLKGAISFLEEHYSLKNMELETISFYLDILDSFMEREKALMAAQEYLTLHPNLSLGNLTAQIILDSWQKVASISIEGKNALEDPDIEFFSLLFKIIKIQYCEGKLIEAAALIATLSPTVECNNDLQSSKIKNGYSYFQYISKLLPLKKNYSEAPSNTVYMVGDSHCLSPAWDEISLNNTNYFIKPLLVTGCKIWHLRDGSLFHAKTNYYRAIELIPVGATVIFVFGEIDCREGILSAIRKGEYSSAKKAIDLLVVLYVKRVMEVIKARGLAHIYIHQIPPVLDATRSIVIEFNHLLEQKIKSLNHNKISWLAFKGGLLDENGGFNSAFDFDETHLDPRYIRTAH